MAKATKTSITKKQTHDEDLRSRLNDEFQRRLLEFEPMICEAIGLAETLSFIAETPNAPVSQNTVAFLTYSLEQRVTQIFDCWKSLRAATVEKLTAHSLLNV